MQTAFRLLLIMIMFTLIVCRSQEVVELKNNEFCLELATNRNGIPFIKKANWLDSGQLAFFNEDNREKIEDWVPNELIPADSRQGSQKNPIWQIESGTPLKKAVAEKHFGDLILKWTFELNDTGSLFNGYVQLENSGADDIFIDWFPGWIGNWNFPTQKETKLHYWQALTYEPQTNYLKCDSSIILHSKIYSSDNHLSDGQVPYWQLDNESLSLFFSIAWCGGWKTEIVERNHGIRIRTILPPEETQLILKPDEIMTGPKIQVYASRDSSEIDSRKHWLTQRASLANHLYTKPQSWYPFIYNHWYSVRFDLSSKFIKKQIVFLEPYDFDVFVIDAGWYNKVGDWTTNTQKFTPGEFEKALQEVSDHNIKVGIWSCPWLLEVENDAYPPEIDEPRFYRKFMNAYAIDLAGYNFSHRLYKHISSLRSQFNMSWWKYDQEFFGEKSRKGKMKNVLALQEALIKVRNTFPDLYIENCMSGGRMINEFTDGIAQIHWIRDGGSSGLKHARSNIKEALGSIQFLSPIKVQRWTNRPDELNENDKELLKYYCRSAMIGVWGISADMSKISESQRELILNERSIYQKLNELKSSLKYEIKYPLPGSDIAGITFYNQQSNGATIVLFRWDKTGNIEPNLNLDLRRDRIYNITNIDTKESVIIEGGKLRKGEGYFTIPQGKLSAIYFIEKI